MRLATMQRPRAGFPCACPKECKRKSRPGHLSVPTRKKQETGGRRCLRQKGCVMRDVFRRIERLLCFVIRMYRCPSSVKQICMRTETMTYLAIIDRVSVPSEYAVFNDGGTIPPKIPVDSIASSSAKRATSPRYIPLTSSSKG